MTQREEGFGRRVRAARAFADLTQVELARRISEMSADRTLSAATIKRLEQEDPSVKGKQVEWSRWVGEATAVPPWFLEHGWDAAQAVAYRSQRFLQEAAEEIRRSLQVDERWIRRSATLPFAILEPTYIESGDADRIARAARTTGDFMQVLDKKVQEEGAAEDESYFITMMRNAYLAIPITRMHVEAIAGVILDQVTHQFETQFQRMLDEDREFGLIGAAMRRHEPPRTVRQGEGDAEGDRAHP